jgi:hypothetical protein
MAKSGSCSKRASNAYLAEAARYRQTFGSPPSLSESHLPNVAHESSQHGGNEYRLLMTSSTRFSYAQPMSSTKPQRTGSTRTMAAVFVALTTMGLGAPLASATAKAANAQSAASGTVTVNGTTTQIRYGYAHQVKGFFDPKKNDVEIVLSDAPLSGAALTDSFARGKLAADGKVHTFEVTIDSKGTPVSSSFHHNGFKGPSPSGLDSSDLFTKKTLTIKLVDARYKSAEDHEFFGNKYAFDVTFRLPIGPKGK